MLPGLVRELHQSYVAFPRGHSRRSSNRFLGSHDFQAGPEQAYQIFRSRARSIGMGDLDLAGRAVVPGFLAKHSDIIRRLKEGHSVRNTEKITGKGGSTVQRVKAALAGAV